MDLGNKTIKTQMKIEMTTPQEDTTLQALEATQEGLQNDKAKTQHPIIIPTDLLPKHKRPQRYKPNIIKVIGYTRTPQGKTSRGQHIQRKEMPTTHRVSVLHIQQFWTP